MIPLTTNSPQCQNLPAQDSKCNFFASALTCNNSNLFINGVLFSIACKKSCNLCDESTTLTPCEDDQDTCKYWIKYCPLLTNLTTHPCKKTCKICT